MTELPQPMHFSTLSLPSSSQFFSGVVVILSLLLVSAWSVANRLCLDKQQEPTEHKLSRVNLMVVCAVEMGMTSHVSSLGPDILVRSSQHHLQINNKIQFFIEYKILPYYLKPIFDDRVDEDGKCSSRLQTPHRPAWLK